MLEFHSMDAPAIGDHAAQVHEVERRFRITRTRGPFEERGETETHHRDAVQLGCIRALSPRQAGGGRRRGTNEKLSSLHHT